MIPQRYTYGNSFLVQSQTLTYPLSLTRGDAEPGSLQFVVGNWHAETVLELLQAIENRAIVIPLAQNDANKRRIANIEHPFYDELRKRNHPGLVLFTSGSSGEPKAAVHDLVPILDKFKMPRKRWRTIPMLGFDHIGGINTLFYTIANGGTLVIPPSRSLTDILRTVEQHHVELLPTSPTFLKMLLGSEAWRRFDLSSLKLITYGTEPMPEPLLEAAAAALPHVEFQQTYGLTELGILRAKSQGRNTTWVKVGGEGYETRVREGKLEIKAASSMLGYLNAPSPFTEDGFFMTGDRVEVRDGWMRFLGRESDVINVGGEKVDPAAVEAILEACPGVQEAVAYGEPHPLMGQIVVARIRGSVETATLKAHCSDLPKHMRPVKYTFTSELLSSERGKKIRKWT